MNILIDIGHPAHVHYFKNFIKIMESEHKIIVIARNRDIIFDLLNKYGIKYYSRGKGANSMFGKLLYTIYADLIIFYFTLKYGVDTLISFSTGYTAQVGWLLNRKTISLNDTEHANKTHSKFVYPFSDSIITPYVYYADAGVKQLKFRSTIEGLYLHQKYFTPDISVLNELGIQRGEKFVLVRFISWNAHHDKGFHGLTDDQKTLIVSTISKRYRVFISSEVKLPAELERLRINIPPDKIHHVLNFATFFVTESGTMASEAAYLGTSVLYTNMLPLMGYLQLARNFGLLKHVVVFDEIIKTLQDFLCNDDIKKEAFLMSDKMKNSFVDITSLFVWFIENYPKSHFLVKNCSLEDQDELYK